MTQAYPLQWPEGWPRTKTRGRARFEVTFDKARQELLWEIQRAGGHYPVLSTNVELRRDGFPYAGKLPEADDPGVAVYFLLKKKQTAFACDRWDRVRDNMRAIHKTIEALRGIERWGASEMMDRAFAAFQALPPPSWRVDLRFDASAKLTAADIEERYRELAKIHHPDRGGDVEQFNAITRARAAARKELGLP